MWNHGQRQYKRFQLHVVIVILTATGTSTCVVVVESLEYTLTMPQEGDDVDASVAMECRGLYADCAENTRRFRAQGCHTALPEDKLLISQRVGALATNVGPLGCLWALGPECGSVGRECGPEGSWIARESGPVLAVFVGLCVLVVGPLQLGVLSNAIHPDRPERRPVTGNRTVS
jgi:hypothetical protein